MYAKSTDEDNLENRVALVFRSLESFVMPTLTVSLVGQGLAAVSVSAFVGVPIASVSIDSANCFKCVRALSLYSDAHFEIVSRMCSGTSFPN